MFNITKLPIMYSKYQFIRQLQTYLINFEIIILTIYCENLEIIKQGVLQTAQISKLEGNFSKFPNQLEIGGEHLFGGIAREVLFLYAPRS